MDLAGNVTQDIKKFQDIENWVAGYLGNGIIGGCFDYAGLQFQENIEGRPNIIGDTYFVSQYHYHHGKFGMDYALPIGRLQAEIKLGDKNIEPWKPELFADINQKLDINQGILTTHYSLKNSPSVKQVQFFSQVRKNLFVLKFDSDSVIQFKFKPVSSTNYHYKSYFETEIKQQEIDGCTIWSVPTNLQTTTIGFKQIDNTLYIAVFSTFEVNDPVEACVEEIYKAQSAGFEHLLSEHIEWWRKYWEESNIQLPYPLGEIWQRANYYIGCSLADQKTHPPLVFGLARVQWPAYFPQDFFYAYENTFRANHPKQAKSTSDFWSDILPHAQDYAKRLFKLDGAVYPWTPPVFDWHDYHIDDIVPNHCYYEMHNSAYVAKMVYDYYLFTSDEIYLREKAYPVILNIARMYAGMTTIKDGRAQILFTPNMTQDERTASNLPNYFDTMISAEYTLTLAKQLAAKFGDEEPVKDFSAILDKGYAYELLHREDTYGVYEGDTRSEDFQKHPVQLNPLTWLPMQRFFSDARVLNYHKKRYEICGGYKDASSVAWTLGQFMLASCRLKKPDEFSKDIVNIQRCGIMDPAYIQTFETTRISPHFLTTIGLFMQAISDTLVQTHNPYVEFFPCILPQWKGEKLEFNNWQLPGGFVVSGAYQDKLVKIELTSTSGNKFEFKLYNEARPIAIINKDGKEVYRGNAGDVISIETKPGATYTIVPA